MCYGSGPLNSKLTTAIVYMRGSRCHCEQLGKASYVNIYVIKCLTDLQRPNFLVYSPNYTAKLPTVLADSEVSLYYHCLLFVGYKADSLSNNEQAFSVYLQAQRAILAATQFVIDLNAAVKEGADMNPIYEKMKDLEAYLEPLLTQSESWALISTTTSAVDITEAVVSRSLRSMARIKLNRCVKFRRDKNIAT